MWDKTDPYVDIISFLCTKMNESGKAWEYLEHSKSRSLLDSLRFLELDTPMNVHEELIAQEKELLSSQIVFNNLIRKTEKTDERIRLTQKIKENEAELDKVYNLIRKNSPEYVDLRKCKPLEIKAIKDLIGA